jgi:hypothetical protein
MIPPPIYAADQYFPGIGVEHVPQPLPLEIPEDFPVPREDDYRFWRYSRFSLPLLLLILAIFTTIILLTMWQARSDIRKLRAGIPRDLEPPTSTNAREGGVPKYRRNIRFALTAIAILLVIIALFVYALPLKPMLRQRLNLLLAVLFFLTGVLGVVVFALDVNSERDAEQCTTGSHETRVCESYEAIAAGVTVFDAGTAIFAFIVAFTIGCYSRSGDWTKQNDYRIGLTYGNPAAVDGYLPGLYPNGVSYVRKVITFLALLGLLIFAVLCLIFTIILHEQRDRYLLVDEFNRSIAPSVDDVTNEFDGPDDDTAEILGRRQPDGITKTNPGWPQKNTELRYAVCSFVILTILVNLIPLNSRVIAYVFGVLYLCYSVITYVSFGVDIDALQEAKNLDCPENLRCVFHPYNATVALLFIGGFFLIVYVILEYLIMHRRKTNPPAVA